MTSRTEWAALDTAGRSELLRARSRAYFAAGHARVTQRPSGTVITLDVREVTDQEGFFCALGDAIQGRGGYFGWDSSSFQDCLVGGFGITPPWTLWLGDEAALARVLDGRELARRCALALESKRYLDEEGREWLLRRREEGLRGERTLWEEFREILAHTGVTVEDMSRASNSS